jgi:hypothetical protein
MPSDIHDFKNHHSLNPKEQFQNNGAAFFLQKNCEALVKRLSGQGNISVGLRFHWRGPGGFAPDPLLDFGSIDGRGQPHHDSRDHLVEAVAGYCFCRMAFVMEVPATSCAQQQKV